MQRILGSVVFLSALIVIPRSARSVDRQTCMDACRQQAVACEAQQCGTQPADADSTCARICGDVYKQCKASCPP